MLKKRIPTIVGLILLIIGAFGGVIFINQGTNFLPRAAPEYAPQKVKITNLSSTGLVISWITTEPATGFVRHGESATDLATTTTDDRDQLAGSSGEYRTHYITLQNLRPSATYYFKLGSQQNQLYDNNGQPFVITTPASLDSPPAEDPIYGTVVTPANTPAEGALVYITLEGSTPLSALVKQNGNWTADLSTSRTLDLGSFSSYDPESAILTLIAQSGTGEPASATTTTANDTPVPTITLGQTHDFAPDTTTDDEADPEAMDEDPEVMDQDPVVNEEPDQTAASKFGASQIGSDDGVDKTLTITSIPKDGAEISDPLPKMSGKAPANASLTISVHSENAYTDQIQADATGKWQWTPPGNLEPGEHTVTISYVDAEGILHKLSRYFVVNAVGVNSLEYSATPSASPDPTPEPTPDPTATPRPTPRTTVATESAELDAGTTTQTFSLILMGFVFLSAGWFLLRRSET